VRIPTSIIAVVPVVMLLASATDAASQCHRCFEDIMQPAHIVIADETVLFSVTGPAHSYIVSGYCEDHGHIWHFCNWSAASPREVIDRIESLDSAPAMAALLAEYGDWVVLNHETSALQVLGCQPGLVIASYPIEVAWQGSD
jgi:hypothetical protein